MRAFHTLFSKPMFDTYEEFNMKDYQILTMILSALKWRQCNGSIKIVGDKKAIDYLKMKKLEFIWDYNLEVIEDNQIEHNMFWAGEKIFALSKQETPVVMLDLDMIVWENITHNLSQSKIVAIHNEAIMDDIYKNKDYFDMKDSYKFDDFDWDVLPSNTALLYIKDKEFKDYYCNKSIEFMKNANLSDDSLSYMVFAEQRLLSMCAKKKNIDIAYLMNYEKDLGKQEYFTHLWGYKRVIENSLLDNDNFCKSCVSRIIKDFPKESTLLLYRDFFMKYV